VPVLWEDNLPQVSIELVCRGIPVLTSDRGGAREIASNKLFVFKSGSTESFISKLSAIVDGKIHLSDFWAQPMRIYSMEHHLAELMSHYAPIKDDESREQPVSSAMHLRPNLYV